MLNAHPAEGETPSFKGSMMLAQAESEAEVRKILENDIYTRSGVWDMENAQIIPVSFSILLFYLFLSQFLPFCFSLFLLFPRVGRGGSLLLIMWGVVQICCS